MSLAVKFGVFVEDHSKLPTLPTGYLNFIKRKRSGSVVECLTQNREAAGSSLTGVTVFWSLSKTHLS